MQQTRGKFDLKPLNIKSPSPAKGMMMSKMSYVSGDSTKELKKNRDAWDEIRESAEWTKKEENDELLQNMDEVLDSY
jgi:hypothetical protein